LFDKLKKKSIEIVCPACKGSQTEPALAFSTFCRTCGEHLKLVKGEARLHSGPQLSGISGMRLVSSKTPVYPLNQQKKAPQSHLNGEKESDQASTFVESKRERKKASRSRIGEKPPQKPTVQTVKKEFAQDNEFFEPEPMEASVAEVFGLIRPNVEAGGEPPKGHHPDIEVDDYQLSEDAITLGKEASPFEDLNAGSMGAMIGDLLAQEEKRELAKVKRIPEPSPEAPKVALPEKPVIIKKEVPKNQVKVRCFRCNHRQWESKHAESTQCGRCNTYISLADYEIRQPTDRIIRTRGNVTVLKKGALHGSDLACRDLLAMGPISTKIDCSGQARFKASATVDGHLHCESLIIDKGTMVEFSQGVYSESVKIYGTLRGDVTCAGLVEIFKTGILDGDVTAQVVDLKIGATLTGEMIINPDLQVKLPEVKGYDSSIID
jgi:cytoskeletal protein CcmA (bactofilin family)